MLNEVMGVNMKGRVYIIYESQMEKRQYFTFM